MLSPLIAARISRMSAAERDALIALLLHHTARVDTIADRYADEALAWVTDANRLTGVALEHRIKAEFQGDCADIQRALDRASEAVRAYNDRLREAVKLAEVQPGR